MRPTSRIASWICIIFLCAAAATAGERLQISITGGWGFFQMDELNNYYIGEYAESVGLLKDDISNGPNLQIDLDYSVSNKITLGAGASYLTGGSSQELFIPTVDEVGTVTGIFHAEAKLRTTALAPHLRAQYIASAGQFKVNLGAAAAYVFGSGSFALESELPTINVDKDYSAGGIGLLTSVGISRPIGRALAVSVVSGYRLYKTDDLKDGDDTWVVEFNDIRYPINLDFSGPYLMAGLSIRL